MQKPHPPILVGGGAKRVLSIAGREADIVSINFNLRPGVVSGDLGPDGTAERVEQKIGWVRDAAGDRFDDIELGVTIFFPVITDDRKATAGLAGFAFGLMVVASGMTGSSLGGLPASGPAAITSIRGHC